jgi:threonine/homoserine/homoserine lactone efflux protein|tara:strand:+ start:14373 stop:14978 length:606 start_codon:yes stop_codon:yes gene_type:complete
VIFLEGYLIGLAMIVFIGPVFFTLLQSALRFGKLSGTMVAFGIIVSDIVCILIYFFGLNSIELPAYFNNIVAAIGALVLIALGLKYLLQKPPNSEVVFASTLNLVSSFTNGFLVNFVNPFVFVVWAGIVLFAKESYSTPTEVQVHLIGVLAGIITTDLLKVLLADKIKPFLKPKILEKTTRFFGIVMIGFAFRLILYLLPK